MQIIVLEQQGPKVNSEPVASHLHQDISLYSDTTGFSLKRLSAEASKLIQADPSQLQEVKQVSFLCHHLSTPQTSQFSSLYIENSSLCAFEDVRLAKVR